MPKRSNAFQQLVYIVKRHAAGDAIVEESAMLVDRITKKRREVDITVTANVGGHAVCVALECRDHRRPADVTWVEQQKGKHERLPTNALVLVSRSGFTTEARELARQYGIDTWALGAIDEGAVARLLGPSGALSAKSWTLTPTRITITVPAQSGLPEETFLASHDNEILRPSGEVRGSVRSFVEEMLRAEPFVRDIGARGETEHTHFEVVAEPPLTKSGESHYVKKIDPPLLRPIQKIRVVGTCSFQVSPLSIAAGRLGNVNVAWGNATLGGIDYVIVVSEGAAGVARASLERLRLPK